VSSVLAAPDLVRYGLFGGDPAQVDRPYGQALWSRVRGFVLSASRLATLPEGKTLQVWFLTDNGPVSVGVCVPDANGQLTLAMDNPPRPPRPVTGVLVTMESGGAQPAPSASTVLARSSQ
jgi:anti-sigma-K factor RskA